MEGIYYVSIANGDYNDQRKGTEDALDAVEFELGAGSQDFIAITNRPLTLEAYYKLQDLLSNPDSYEKDDKYVAED